MPSIYEIFWTKHASQELAQTVEYLEQHFSSREIENLERSVNNVLLLIAKNPKLFQEIEKQKGIHQVIVATFNTLYYRIKGNTVEILSFFSNRQNPDKLKY